MSQKDYNILIILALLKKENHIRGLAKELKTNQTTISRKIHELFIENVVDYDMRGKNKVFFLKKTLEAKHNVFIAEQHKLLIIISAYPWLRDVILQIQRYRNVDLAILFGSYAKLIADKKSDIDVYIDTSDRKFKKELELINSRLSIKTGDYDKENLLIKEIEKNHAIIKGVELFYEKNRFFS